MTPHVNCSCPTPGYYLFTCPTHGWAACQPVWAAYAHQHKLDPFLVQLRVWPSPADPCYDCGSNVPGHHTLFCEFAGAGDVRDLPSTPGTQHWSGEAPDYRKVAQEWLKGAVFSRPSMTEPGSWYEARRSTDIHFPPGLQVYAMQPTTVETLIGWAPDPDAATELMAEWDAQEDDDGRQ